MWAVNNQLHHGVELLLLQSFEVKTGGRGRRFVICTAYKIMNTSATTEARVKPIIKPKSKPDDCGSLGGSGQGGSGIKRPGVGMT